MRHGLGKVLPVVALALLAWVGTRFSEPLALGIDFTFGSIASLLALLTAGPIAGVLVAAVGSLAKMGAWDFPFYAAISILEVVLVGFVLRHVWNQLIVASAAFWILAASLLAWTFFHVHLNANFETTLFVWLKYSINGVFNALLASMLMMAWELFSFSRGKARKKSFDSILFTALAASVFIPMFIIIIASSREKYRGYEMEARSKVSDVSQSIDLFLRNFRKNRINLVRNVADLVPLDPQADAAELNRNLAIAHKAFPNFEELMVVDTEGKVLSSLTTLKGPVSGSQGLDLANHLPDILENPPVVDGLSGVLPEFMGRQGPFVVFANPVDSGSGLRGYVLGLVNLTYLEESLDRYSNASGTEITLTDSDDVLAATSWAERNVASSIADLFIGPTVLRQGGFYQRFPDSGVQTPVNRWRESIYGVKTKSASSWNIYVDVPMGPYYVALQAYYTDIFKLLLTLCVVGLVVSFFLANLFSRPVRELAKATTGIPDQMQAHSPGSIWPKVFISELDSLIHNFESVSDALRRRFDDLRLEIDERKKTQAELEAATAGAQAANRAKSTFLANMSHEIRTPLGVVMGFSEMLSQDNLSQKARLEAIKTVKRNGNQLLTLIDDILDLSRIEAGHIKIEEKPTALGEILSSGLDGFSKVALEKGITFTVGNSTKLPVQITTDPTRCVQILSNLVGNAVKFTNIGFVEVDFSFERLGIKMGRLIMRVKDSGIGMEASAATHLFQPFGQVDSSVTRRFGGTGLGLVLSRKLANSMGGDVQLLATAPDQGSIFEAKILVQAPEDVPMGATIADVKAWVAEQSNTSGAKQEIAGAKILVVEDSLDIQRIMQLNLERCGVDVSLASSGAEGIDKALSQDFDLIFMDVQMPILDGLDATRMLRSSGYSKPIVALTAHALKEDRDRCLRAGCDEYLAKPVDQATLSKTIALFAKARPQAAHPAH